MKIKEKKQWHRLDNAAKMFPVASGKKDTKVFRIAGELTETVKKPILELALEKTLKEFPVFQSVLRRGLFWYYLETTNRKAVVHEEHKYPCSPLYDRNKRGLLFDVSFYKKRINLEVHHALTDGTGGMIFLNSLVAHYLELAHEKELAGVQAELDLDASIEQKMDDSFYRYYDDSRKESVASVVNEKTRRAYIIRGATLPENRIKVLEGHMSVQKVKELAKTKHTTITVYLTALLLCAIHDGMTVREQKYPVGIMVPVNLRNYFKSSSVRNFFGTIDIVYDFSRQSSEFEDIIQYVEQIFEQELTKEKMVQRVNHYGALENNVLMRVIPLFLKDIVMKRFYKISERKYTFTISNIGRIRMPEAISSYIKQYSVFVSTTKKQVCVCSFGDNLVVSFTSPLVSTEVERNFFRALTDKGVPVEIVCTPGWEE